MARLAFFDLDGTLLSINSGDVWIRREARAGRISALQAGRALLWLLQYRMGFADGQDMILQAISTLKGSPGQELRERTAHFFHAEVQGTYRPGGRAALARHRQAGDVCLLLTSSTNYLAELVREDLQLDGILCNHLQVDAQGLHTGGLDGEVCFGAGKRVVAQAEARARGLRLEEAVFYTDSHSDRSVLEVVQEPVVVNPDPRLARLAAQRGWPVVDWGT